MPAMQRLTRAQIDNQRWDQCVQTAAVDLPYALTWFLDAVAADWDGLIFGDYELVFPLVWERKWGVRRIYQPYFCQQLGFFGCREPTDTEKEQLKRELKTFWYVDMHLHYRTSWQLPEISFRTNLILPLNADYADIFEDFSRDLRKCIRAAARHGLSITVPESPDEFLHYYLLFLDREKFRVNTHHEESIRKLVWAAHRAGASLFRLVHHPDQGIVFCQFMVMYKKRMLNLMAEGTKEARGLRANHFVLNQIIREYAGKGYVLDFEGSSIPAVADFFQRFNPQKQPFFRYHHSRIPFLK